MKDKLTTIAIAVILFLVVFNAIKDNSEMHDHEDFFADMRTFMNKGGRNTSDMGKELCERMNTLERQQYIEETDCESIYGR